MKKSSYNKKRGTFNFASECHPRKLGLTLIQANECLFFIANTNKIKSNKIKEIYLRNFIIKVHFFILTYLLSTSKGERHSH